MGVVDKVREILVVGKYIDDFANPGGRRLTMAQNQACKFEKNAALMQPIFPHHFGGFEEKLLRSRGVAPSFHLFGVFFQTVLPDRGVEYALEPEKVKMDALKVLRVARDCFLKLVDWG